MATTSDTAILGHALRHKTENVCKPGTVITVITIRLIGKPGHLFYIKRNNPLQLSQPEPNDESDFFMDEDLFDEIADDEAPGLGILVRTDFSNDEAWGTFLAKLKEGEEEFSSSSNREGDTEMDQGEPSASAPRSASTSDDKMDDDKNDSDGSSDQDQDSVPIISILNPSLEIRPYFSDISNLTALRLLNDVDLRKLVIPPNTKRFDPPNPIVDYDGWQEIYHGKTLWIYDATSNRDQCARLVSKRSDFYGTATLVCHSVSFVQQLTQRAEGIAGEPGYRTSVSCRSTFLPVLLG